MARARRPRSPREAVLASPARGELRFVPEGELQDPRGRRWSVEGSLEVLDGRLRDGVLETPAYPDALARAWSALTCPNSGEVLLSAAEGFEFVDWGRQAHVGGGSHGSLHRSDSLGALLFSGLAPPDREPRQWAIRDVAALVLDHFGVPHPGPVSVEQQ